jgi:hypothetical protein
LKGAALDSFRSRIICYLIKYGELSSNDDLTLLADQVARDFQITLGPNTIPILLKDIQNNESMMLKHLNHEQNNYTGKILVDLSDEMCGLLQLEYEVINSERNEITTTKMLHTIEMPNVKLTHEVMPSLLELSILKNVNFIQMFDTSMLMSNAAFDDNTVMECVLEKLNEWKEYPR